MKSKKLLSELIKCAESKPVFVKIDNVVYPIEDVLFTSAGEAKLTNDPHTHLASYEAIKEKAVRSIVLTTE
jgi:hypothetical protein